MPLHLVICPEWSRLVHPSSGWASQSELTLALPGPDLKGSQLQADPVGLGSADCAGFDPFPIVPTSSWHNPDHGSGHYGQTMPGFGRLQSVPVWQAWP